MADAAKKSRAKEEYQTAIELLDSLIQSQAEPAKLMDDRHRLLRYRNNLGKFLAATGKRDEAFQVLNQAVKDADVFSLESPGLVGLNGHARAKTNLAFLWLRSQLPAERRAKARPLLEDARAGLEGMIRDFPRTVDYQQEYSTVARNLSSCDTPPDAAARLKAEVDRLAILIEKYPNIPEFRRLHAWQETALGTKLRGTKRLGEAEGVLQSARRELHSLVQQYYDEPVYHRDLGNACIELAKLRDVGKAVGRREHLPRRGSRASQDLRGSGPGARLLTAARHRPPRTRLRTLQPRTSRRRGRDGRESVRAVPRRPRDLPQCDGDCHGKLPR